MGGAEKRFVTLADELTKRHHRVILVPVFPGGALFSMASERGIDVRPLSGEKRKSRISILLQTAGAFLRLRRMLREPEISTLYSVLWSTNVMGLVASLRVPGCRAIWGFASSKMELNPARAIPYRLGSILSPLLETAISNSTKGVEDAKADGFRPQRWVVIPNGVDLERYKSDQNLRTATRAAWAVRDEDILIGIIGRLDPIKDHDSFFRAGAALQAGTHKVSFVCIGEGKPDVEQHIRLIARNLGLEDRTVWIGRHDNMVSVYNALDVLCSSSKSEGFPNVVAEAMACGTPCVATDVGDSRRIVGSHGLIAPAGNPAMLAKRLQQMISQLDQVDEDAMRAHIRNNFSLGKMVDETEAVLFGP